MLYQLMICSQSPWFDLSSSHPQSISMILLVKLHPNNLNKRTSLSAGNVSFEIVILAANQKYRMRVYIEFTLAPKLHCSLGLCNTLSTIEAAYLVRYIKLKIFLTVFIALCYRFQRG